ncbi:MAG: hypothetical protein ACYTFM_13205 [Planctomycetota bacterium]
MRAKARRAETEEKSGIEPKEKPKGRKKSLIEAMLGEIIEQAQKAVSEPKPQRTVRRTRPVERKKHKIEDLQQVKLTKKLGRDIFSDDIIPDVLKEPNDINVSEKDLMLKITPSSESEVFKDMSPSFILSSQLLNKGTEELRKAILYYEILGKPLSLREPRDSAF